MKIILDISILQAYIKAEQFEMLSITDLSWIYLMLIKESRSLNTLKNKRKK